MARTYNEAGIELLPGLEDEFTRIRRRKLRDKLGQHQIYSSGKVPSFEAPCCRSFHSTRASQSQIRPREPKVLMGAGNSGEGRGTQKWGAAA